MSPPCWIQTRDRSLYRSSRNLPHTWLSVGILLCTVFLQLADSRPNNRPHQFSEPRERSSVFDAKLLTWPQNFFYNFNIQISHWALVTVVKANHSMIYNRTRLRWSIHRRQSTSNSPRAWHVLLLCLAFGRSRDLYCPIRPPDTRFWYISMYFHWLYTLLHIINVYNQWHYHRFNFDSYHYYDYHPRSTYDE